ncbi:MAG: hypothetical protein K1X50_02840 [Candidatus Promineofilum sp.]|nr:hypothetical protein [Promineifilum sp.]MCW5862821.1 hypothetical protein [Anaerolineae bacterium]
MNADARWAIISLNRVVSTLPSAEFQKAVNTIADNATYAAVKPHLRDGELLLWAGRPKQGFALRARDIGASVIGILFVGPSMLRLASEVLAANDRATPVWVAALLLAGVVGLARWIYGFVEDIRRRGALWYAVTDARVLFVTGRELTYAEQLGLNELDSIKLSRRFDGTGTITFVSRPHWRRRQPSASPEDDWPWRTKPGERIYAFEMIANSRAVEKLILAAKESVLKASEPGLLS